MENFFAWKSRSGGKNQEQERRDKVRERLTLYNIEQRLVSYDRRKRARQIRGVVDAEFEFARMRVQHVLESSTLTSEKDVREALEAIDLINGKLAVAGVSLDVPPHELVGPIEASLGEIESEDFAYAIHDQRLQQAGEDLEESRNEYYALYRRFRGSDVALFPARIDLLTKANTDVRESIEHFASTYRKLMEKRHPGVSYRAQEQAIIESAYAQMPTLTGSTKSIQPTGWVIPEVALPSTRSGRAVQALRAQEPLRMREYARAMAAAVVLFAVGVQIGRDEGPASPFIEQFDTAAPAPDLRAFIQEPAAQEAEPAQVVESEERAADEALPAEIGGAIQEESVEPEDTIATNVHGRRI